MNNNHNYVLRKHKLSGRWNFDIENKNLIYADMSPTHHGLQCNYIGGTKEHEQIKELCSSVIKLIKEIDRINNPEDYK